MRTDYLSTRMNFNLRTLVAKDGMPDDFGDVVAFEFSKAILVLLSPERGAAEIGKLMPIATALPPYEIPYFRDIIAKTLADQRLPTTVSGVLASSLTESFFTYVGIAGLVDREISGKGEVTDTLIPFFFGILEIPDPDGGPMKSTLMFMPVAAFSLVPKGEIYDAAMTRIHSGDYVAFDTKMNPRPNLPSRMEARLGIPHDLIMHPN